MGLTIDWGRAPKTQTFLHKYRSDGCALSRDLRDTFSRVVVITLSYRTPATTASFIGAGRQTRAAERGRAGGGGGGERADLAERRNKADARVVKRYGRPRRATQWRGAIYYCCHARRTCYMSGPRRALFFFRVFFPAIAEKHYSPIVFARVRYASATFIPQPLLRFVRYHYW